MKAEASSKIQAAGGGLPSPLPVEPGGLPGSFGARRPAPAAGRAPPRPGGSADGEEPGAGLRGAFGEGRGPAAAQRPKQGEVRP